MKKATCEGDSTMQPNINAKVTIAKIAAKEITLFFASPIAYLFLATFATITLFVFFWGQSFFSRNISDVRPLFESMPVLLIFLSSTLTMRLWSEERRSGTLEYILTQPVPLWHFVVGKFLGCLFLLVIALFITLPLPITVSIIGELDWGPVLAGYLATLLMGAAYLSIGLFVSARSDNQIVSLIVASIVCGCFYLIGTPTITNFFGNQDAEWLRLFGTGARFDSITRGVIDIRDLYYYMSLILIFLSLNVFVLEKERWANSKRLPHHQSWLLITLLMIANAFGTNLWLGQLNMLRVDATQGDQYTISDATLEYLAQLQEPLLLRGYFSKKTHPLLAPLVPQMRDLIREYEIAEGGKIRVEIVDPLNDPEIEKEANQKYGIQPVPFEVADRYQSAIVSSYFNILVQYGDEHKVLGFRDLIEVNARSEADIEVQLRNPEHDLTSAIRKILNQYQSGGNLFDTVKDQITFNAYFSNDSLLPEQLITFKKELTTVLDEISLKAFGRFKINMLDPDINNGEIAKMIQTDYGFRPMATSLFSDQQFYFYMTLSHNSQIVQIPLDDMTSDGFKRNLEAGIKRFASGFTKTVALVVPELETSPYDPRFGQVGARFSQLETFLGTDLNITKEDLTDGAVSGEVDILVLAAPKNLNEKQLFAVDQFLMKGGTVIAATSPFTADLSNRGLSVKKHQSGLDKWLTHHGLTIEEKLVLDPQNATFPIPITRNVSGFQMQDIRMIDYPYFIDVRKPGLNSENLITSEIPQATLTWASPISVTKDEQSNREITELLHSSDGAWQSSSMDVTPRLTSQGISSFYPEGETGRHLLGVISQGKFNSYFTGKESPLIGKEKQDKDVDTTDDDENNEAPSVEISSFIERSSDAARIILISSNDFLRDQILQLAASTQRSEYINTLQMTANAIDWSLDDSGLLAIRSRGHFNRTLPPMELDEQKFWEYLNYGLTILALLIIAIMKHFLKLSKQRRFLEQLAQ